MKLFEVLIDAPGIWAADNDEVLRNKVRNEGLMAEFKAAFPKVRVPAHEEGHSDFKVLVDGETALDMIDRLGIVTYSAKAFQVKKATMIADTTDLLSDRLSILVDKMEKRLSRLDDMSAAMVNQAEALGFNAHTSAAIPGGHLGTVNSLMLLEDCCTDNLQGHLDDGWRLLAVCPQEARRPDYVLGRHESEYVARGSARR